MGAGTGAQADGAQRHSVQARAGTLQSVLCITTPPKIFAQIKSSAMDKEAKQNKN